MKFFHSIRWRLQAWHSLILIIVLIGIAWPAWDVQRANLESRIDLELEQRLTLLARFFDPAKGHGPRRPPPPIGMLADESGPPEPPPFDERRLPPPDFNDFELPEREAELFKGTRTTDFYYALYDRDGSEQKKSEYAPDDLPGPDEEREGIHFRTRGYLRECLLVYRSGHSMIVGRDTSPDYKELKNFAWFLTSAGLVVLLIGLLGGWWLSSRAIRPIKDISGTAKKISKGDLSQRIPLSDTDSELGELAAMLNHTFARLQANFEQQAQFTGDAAHELRTPVAVLLTQTQTALARERDAGEYKESLEACERAAKRMRSLTESLLALARLDTEVEKAPREYADLARIVSESVEQFSALAQEKGIDIKQELDPAFFSCNPDQISQVVNNLLSNAIQYSDAGCHVMVSVKTESNQAVLQVRDNGRGIPETDLPHIFKRFYRADKSRTRSQGRVGLGLAITETIVKAHGGTIAVESTVGRRTSFTVRFPLPEPA